MSNQYAVIANFKDAPTRYLGSYCDYEGAVGASYLNALDCIDKLKNTKDSFGCYIYLDAHMGKLQFNNSYEDGYEIAHLNVYRDRKSEQVYCTFLIFAMTDGK